MNRILIVRMSALGDIVHALPVLSSLRDAFPHAELDWLVDSTYAPVLDLVDGIENRVVVRPHYVRAIQFMRGRRYDVALDLQGLLKSAAAARLSGARRIIGFESAALRERTAAWFYTEQARVPSGAHVIERNCAVLPLIGVSSASISFPFRVHASAVADKLQSAAPAGFALLNPGAAWPNKRWPADRFGALAERIRERHGLPSFVLWGAGESKLADRVVAAAQGAATRAPETTLADLLAVSKAARLMVSGDTGPLHLAAAMHTPIVGLYGPTWPERNGPWDAADVVVSRANRCQCHHKRRCVTGRMCIKDISVDEVVAAVDRRLALVC